MCALWTADGCACLPTKRTNCPGGYVQTVDSLTAAPTCPQFAHIRQATTTIFIYRGRKGRFSMKTEVLDLYDSLSSLGVKVYINEKMQIALKK